MSIRISLKKIHWTRVWPQSKLNKSPTQAISVEFVSAKITLKANSIRKWKLKCLMAKMMQTAIQTSGHHRNHLNTQDFQIKTKELKAKFQRYSTRMAHIDWRKKVRIRTKIRIRMLINLWNQVVSTIHNQAQSCIKLKSIALDRHH